MKSEIASFLYSHRLRAFRAENMHLADLEFEAGSAFVRSMPHLLNIETTTYCNLKCVMCPHGNDAMPKGAHLEASIIANIASLLPHIRSMQLFGTGEALASPSFWTTLELLQHWKGTEISIYSNGTLLIGERINRLLNSALTQINISLDAARAETYTKLRGADFNRVIGNIRELVCRRNLSLSRRLTILLNMTLMRENIEELCEFIDLAAALGVDGVFFSHMNDSESDYEWTTTKGNWNFNYKAQLLKSTPSLSNRMVEAATKRGIEKKMNIQWSDSKSKLFRQRGFP